MLFPITSSSKKCCYNLFTSPTLAIFCLFHNSHILTEGFPCGSAGKESTCNAGDLDSIPGLGRSPGEGKGSPLQYSGLENSKDCIVHGVTVYSPWGQTQLSNFYILTDVKSQISQSTENKLKNCKMAVTSPYPTCLVRLRRKETQS